MESNPDPIYLCEELKACEGRGGSQAHISQLSVQPTAAKQGQNFNFSLSYSVTNRTGTGQINLYAQTEKTALAVIGTQFIEDLAVGDYSTFFLVVTDTSSSWPPGVYTAKIEICEGTCGSTYPDCKVLDSHGTTFTLTPA